MKSAVSTNQFGILESILHGVIITDIKGHIAFWNPTNEKLFGYTADEIMGKHIRILYGENEETSFKRILTETHRDQEVHGQWHGKHKNGSRIWLDVRAKLLINDTGDAEICVITICNIGKLKSTERKLQKKEILAKAIFDNTADAIITMSEEGTILSSNRAITKMFGYQEVELIGQNVNILLPFPFNDSGDGFMKNVVNTGETRITGMDREIQGLKKDGTVFPIELTISDIKWDDSRLFTGIIRNLTAKKNLERRIFEIGNEERRRIGRELHDALGQMLTGIRLLSENLAKKLQVNELPGTEEVKEIAEMVKEADEYTRKLSRGLVQVDLEKKGLSLALQNLCSQFTKASGVQCNYSESGNVEIENHTLALHIYRIVQEAINNAVKHAEPDKIMVRISSNPDHTAVTISDNGKGFLSDTEHESGSGIEIMKYRAGIMGGIFEIVRTEQGLTQVRCIVPNNLEKFN